MELSARGLPSLRITQGYHVVIRAPDYPGLLPHQERFKHGFTNELKDWLLEHVGQPATNLTWENGEGDWIHTGCRQGKVEWVNAHTPSVINSMDFYFRDRRRARRFKIVWERYFEIALGPFT
jgi:hypothetical protein